MRLTGDLDIVRIEAVAEPVGVLPDDCPDRPVREDLRVLPSAGACCADYR